MFPKDIPVRLEGKALAALRIACFLRDAGRCVICGVITWLDAPEEHPRKADMAHIKSRGAGGSDTLDNVRNNCHRCHMRRHNGGKPCPPKPALEMQP
jgi:5-methylcytosine-specific restriction endonuclease McrA